MRERAKLFAERITASCVMTVGAIEDALVAFTEASCPDPQELKRLIAELEIVCGIAGDRANSPPAVIAARAALYKALGIT